MIQLPVVGQLHFNPSTNNWEMYDGSNWRIIIPEPHIIPWEKWWAWRPVKNIHGQWQWGKTVYRRQPWLDNNYPGYEYGTLFDVLKEAQ